MNAEAPGPRFPNEGTWPPAVYRSADTRAQVAQVVHGIAALVALGTAVVLAQVYDLLDRAERFALSDAEVDAWAGRVEITDAAATWAALISFISLVAWLSRSVDNTPSLGGGIARRGPRWAIGAWFIPLVNIVMPPLIMRDLARRVSPTKTGRGGLVLLWWAAYWLPVIVGFYILAIPFQGTDSIREAYAWLIGAQVINAIGYFVTLYLVRTLQQDAEYWHRKRSAELQAATQAAIVEAAARRTERASAFEASAQASARNTAAPATASSTPTSGSIASAAAHPTAWGADPAPRATSTSDPYQDRPQGGSPTP